jgi:hypothetical protein
LLFFVCNLRKTLLFILLYQFVLLYHTINDSADDSAGDLTKSGLLGSPIEDAHVNYRKKEANENVLAIDASLSTLRN